MSTDKKAHHRGSTYIMVGELVIMRDSQRGTIQKLNLKSAKPIYTVRMSDNSQRIVNADDLVRATWYADVVAPGTGWKGEERRKVERRDAERREGEQRTPERAAPGRRMEERRMADRRS